ncbi:MAG: hypothetical protein ACXWUP_09925 [Allosphingosinicella sp.]
MQPVPFEDGVTSHAFEIGRDDADLKPMAGKAAATRLPRLRPEDAASAPFASARPTFADFFVPAGWSASKSDEGRMSGPSFRVGAASGRGHCCSEADG